MATNTVSGKLYDKNGCPVTIDLVNISNPHSTIADTAECRLFRAVIQQAIIDTTDADKNIRQDALDYLNSDDLLETMDCADIDRRYANKIRSMVNSGYGMEFRTKTFGTGKQQAKAA